MTYMTAMDRLAMCCIFLLEGLRAVGGWRCAGPRGEAPQACGPPGR